MALIGQRDDPQFATAYDNIPDAAAVDNRARSDE
jgi:hypothetical protein